MLLRQLFGAAIAMLTTVFLARNLSLADYGLYASLSLLPIMAASIASLGAGPSAAYHMSGGRFRIDEVVPLAFVLGLACSLGTALILFGTLKFKMLPDELISVESQTIIAILTTIPVLIFTNLSAALQGMQKFKEFGLITITPPTILLFVLLLVAHSSPNKLSIENTIIGFAFAHTVSALIVIAYFRRAFRGLSPSRLSSQQSCMKALVSYGLKAHLANVLSILNYRLNYYIILALGGSSNLGLFAVVASLCEALWMLSSAAGTIIFPTVAATKDNDAATQVSLDIARWVMYLTILATALLLILAYCGILTTIFGERFSPISNALLILAPGIVSLSFARVLANDLAGRGHPTVNTKIAATSLAVNTVANLISIETYGLLGVAAASSLSYLVLSTLTIKAYSRITNTSTGAIICPRRQDIKTGSMIVRRIIAGFKK